MQMITLSKFIHRRFHEHVSPGRHLATTSMTENADGTVTFPIDDDTYERMREIDRDPEKAIVKLFNFADDKKRHDAGDK